jgi:hypothetical protein
MLNKSSHGGHLEFPIGSLAEILKIFLSETTKPIEL